MNGEKTIMKLRGGNWYVFIVTITEAFEVKIWLLETGWG